MRTTIPAMALFTLLLMAGYTFAAPVCGEVNENGTVSSSDALLVLRKGVGLDVFPSL